MGPREQGDQIDKGECCGSKTRLRDLGYSITETEQVHCDIDQMDENASSRPWSKKSMTTKNVWIGEVLTHDNQYMSGELHDMGKKIDDEESCEDAARGNSIHLSNIHV